MWRVTAPHSYLKEAGMNTYDEVQDALQRGDAGIVAEWVALGLLGDIHDCHTNFSGLRDPHVVEGEAAFTVDAIDPDASYRITITRI